MGTDRDNKEISAFPQKDTAAKSATDMQKDAEAGRRTLNGEQSQSRPWPWKWEWTFIIFVVALCTLALGMGIGYVIGVGRGHMEARISCG